MTHPTEIYKKAIVTVANKCLAAGIPFDFHRLYDGWQLTFSWTKGDVACSSMTSCSIFGDVETFEFPWDNRTRESMTIMKPADAFERIARLYSEYLNRELYLMKE